MIVYEFEKFPQSGKHNLFKKDGGITEVLVEKHSGASSWTEYQPISLKEQQWVKLPHSSVAGGMDALAMLRPNGVIYLKVFYYNTYEWHLYILTPREFAWTKRINAHSGNGIYTGYVPNGTCVREIAYNIPRRMFQKGAPKRPLNRPDLRVSTGRMDGFTTDTHLYFYRRRSTLRVGFFN